MLPLATDADVDGRMIRQLRRKLPEIDLVRAQDELPADTPDPEVLEWAAAVGRVLITQDEQTMIGHAYTRIAAGLPTPGVIVRNADRVGMGETIDEIIFIALCGHPEDFKDQVRFLPL